MERAKLVFIILFHKIIKVLPDRVLLEVTFFASPVIQHLFPKVKHQLYKNNSVAFSDCPEDELKRIVNQALTSFFQSKVFDFKYGFSQSHSVQVELEFPRLRFLKKKFKHTAVVCAVPHLGMQLVAAKLIAKYSKRKVVVPVRGLKSSSSFEKKLLTLMSDQNIEFVRSGQAMKHILKGINQKAVILLGCDVIDTVKHTQVVDFFGKNVSLPSGPVWLAEKFKLPLITAYATMEYDPFRIKVKVDTEVAEIDDQVLRLQQVATRLENYIKSNPGKWCIPDNYFEKPLDVLGGLDNN